MKSMKIVFLPVIIMVTGMSLAFAAQEGSVGNGKALFNDPKLGASGKTCNTCHVDGKGLEKSGSKADLTNIINGCITNPLKGTALDAKSVEMQSLVLYIKSLGVKTPAAKKKAPVGC